MNILVTGAGGTIGSAIVEDLLHNVSILFYVT